MSNQQYGIPGPDHRDPANSSGSSTTAQPAWGGQQPAAAPNQPHPFYVPQRTGDFRPAEQRIAREIGAPIALIVIAAILAFALAALAGLGNPVAFLIGTIPSVIGLVIGLGCYLWLDRWEPEPPRLLLAAFLWGGGIATVGALLIGLLLEWVGLSGQFFGVVIQAPIVEEALKAAWLFIMLTGARRREMTSLTDHLVYAGFSAFGFAFVENLMYFASAENVQSIVFMALIRTGVNLFGHALYTSATAIGIYYARKGTGKMKPGPVILGYLVAVLLHALWNGSAFFGLQALGLVYLVLLVPAFIYVVRLGINSRNQEGDIVARQLDRMVYEGIVSAQDAGWLRQLTTRKEVAKQADRKTPEGKRTRDVADAVTELAIIRERLATMTQPSPFLLEEERYLIGALRNESGRLAGVAMPMATGGQSAMIGQHAAQPTPPNQPWQQSSPQPTQPNQPWQQGSPQPTQPNQPWQPGSPQPVQPNQPWQQGSPQPTQPFGQGGHTPGLGQPTSGQSLGQSATPPSQGGQFGGLHGPSGQSSIDGKGQHGWAPPGEQADRR